MDAGVALNSADSGQRGNLAEGEGEGSWVSGDAGERVATAAGRVSALEAGSRAASRVDAAAFSTSEDLKSKGRGASREPDADRLAAESSKPGVRRKPTPVRSGAASSKPKRRRRRDASSSEGSEVAAEKSAGRRQREARRGGGAARSEAEDSKPGATGESAAAHVAAAANRPDSGGSPRGDTSHSSAARKRSEIASSGARKEFSRSADAKQSAESSVEPTQQDAAHHRS